MSTHNSQVAASGRGRGPGRPFQRGVSGNPGGRPRAVHDVQELARQHTPQAIAALVAALANPRERVQAAVAILDRGWGRPLQPVRDESDNVTLHLVAARLVSDELRAELDAKPLTEPAETQSPQTDDLLSLPAPQE